MRRTDTEKVFSWRKLSDEEIRQLTQQGNTAENWEFVSVLRDFSCHDIWNCHFSGPVKIGERVKLRNISEIRGYELHNATIRDVPTIIDSDSWLHKPFEYPLVKLLYDGNEDNIGVVVTPEMNTAHVYASLYSRTPRLFCSKTTSEKFSKMGFIEGNIVNVGAISGSIIRNARLHDCEEVRNCWIEGCSIGTGVRLNRTVVQGKASVTSGSDISNSLICREAKIDAGARIYHSVIGDFSEIFGGEIGHSFLDPCQKMHHRNSLVYAAHLRGMCHITAGSSIGSKPADTELTPYFSHRNFDTGVEVGKGFRMGANTTVVRPSFFAPFTFLNEGSYPYPLNIPFPFSRVSNNIKEDCLEVAPAYWWMHHAYAIAKVELEAQGRHADFWWLTRVGGAETLSHEFEFTSMRLFCPEVISNIISSHRMLSKYVAGKIDHIDMEMSKRPVRLLQPEAALQCYREMLLLFLYGEEIPHLPYVGDLPDSIRAKNPCNSPEEFVIDIQSIKDSYEPVFINAGGLTFTSKAMEQLRQSGDGSWADFWGNFYQNDGRLIPFVRYGEKPLLCYVVKYLCGEVVTEVKIKALFEEADKVHKRFVERVMQERSSYRFTRFPATNRIYLEPAELDPERPIWFNPADSDEVCLFAKSGDFKYKMASGHIKNYQ